MTTDPNLPQTENSLTLDVETLKAERERVKGQLRELEKEQRRLEAELKSFRQREIRAKRQIEALTTLIDINHPSPATSEESPSS